MIEIANRLRRVYAFQLRREYLCLLVMDQPRIRARDFQYHFRELLDRVQIGAANVVCLTSTEVIRDVRDCANGIGEICRSARVAAENGPRQSV